MVFTSFIFLLFTKTLSATLAWKISFAFLTQTFSLQQEYYFQYKDKSSSIFGVTSLLSASTTTFPPSPVVSWLTSTSLDDLEDSFFANIKQAQILWWLYD